MRIILLLHEQPAFMDDEDYQLVKDYNWYLHSGGYAYAYVGQENGKAKYVLMHRLILGLEEDEKQQVDHISGNKLDNRRSNLRIATNAQNQMNSKSRRGSSSKYKGVRWKKDHQKWEARGTVDGVLCHLGYWDRDTDAAEAYNVFATKHFGEFAKLNQL